MRLEGGHEGVPALWEVTLALVVTLACSCLIAMVYRRTHRTPGYSQSYVQSMVLTSLVTSMIMIVIGSNLARAFSLLGALSIIRFRNAIKETRDVGFIFFAMAVAMASGTRFYGIAVLGTIFICTTMLIFDAIGFGASTVQAERLLKIQTPPDLDLKAAVQPVLEKHFDAYTLVVVETLRDGVLHEAVYSVKPRGELDPNAVIAELQAVNEKLKVAYFYGYNADAP